MVWTDAQGEGRNLFAFFRRTFKLAKIPARALLHLFADTRYRLRVNGHIAAYGPARFTPKAPQYDSVDLAPYLVKGRNVVTVEVNHKGASSFESLPGLAGFLAWGAAGQGKDAVDLSTPGAWKAMPLTAVDPWAPPFSFAQGPVEIADLRGIPAAWFEASFDDGAWPAPTPLANQGFWGPFTPRSIPMLTMHERLPERTLTVAALDATEYRIGCRIDASVGPRGSKRPRVCYATHLYSPEEQDVTIGIWWGPNYLNGEPIQRVKTERLGNREDYPVRLRKGWNFLYGEPEMLAECWSILIGIPAGKGIVASAEPREGAAACMIHSGPVDVDVLERERTRVPADLKGLPEVGGWTPVPHGARVPAPGREMAWDTPGQKVDADPYQVTEIAIPGTEANGGVVVFDFGGEFLGHARLDIEAPAGTVVDVCNDERLRADGMIDVFKTNWWIGSADRFVLRGGRETVEGFHPRGGRYLSVAVRDAKGPVILHRLTVRQTTYPLQREGRFECSDPLYNWVFEAGTETLQACMEDAYLDCPWRERGAYVGDSLVEYQANRAVSADPAMVRRCLWLWAKAQMDGGQMQDVVPAWKYNPLHDYTLLWIVILRDYWAATGDLSLAKEVWPSVAAIFASPDWVEAPGGLWNADNLHVFCDWGAAKETKKGESGPLNAIRCGAYEAAAQLAAALKKPAEAARYRKEHARAAKIFQSLWDDGQKRYAATRMNGARVTDGALHSNILALFFGLVSDARKPAVLRYIEERLPENLKRQGGYAELYFFYFLLNVLYDHGRTGLAEQAIRSNYGFVRSQGAWTIWEGIGHNGSRCHAWSCAPMHTMAERTLGVRQTRAKPDEVLVAPDSASLTWARGSVPHRRGTIDVDWRIERGVLILDVAAPKAVRLKVKPAGGLARLPLQLTTRKK
ncbi:MAG: family 78 glycoside hydrolase catalytic domain [Planctomycetota bacterium]|nr:family 78 glycoside hydrolase catalytic domain [Planctomycetota bacterium]